MLRFTSFSQRSLQFYSLFHFLIPELILVDLAVFDDFFNAVHVRSTVDIYDYLWNTLPCRIQQAR
jgi:hypothetical protein